MKYFRKKKKKKLIFKDFLRFSRKKTYTDLILILKSLFYYILFIYEDFLIQKFRNVTLFS